MQVDMRATVQLFTFKAGLLARAAHDLRLSVSQFEIEIHARKVRAWFDASSLRVDGVMTKHGLETQRLSESDQRQILATVRSEILCSDQFPRVTFQAELATGLVEAPRQLDGLLELRGREERCSIALTQIGTQLQASLELTPSRFGIQPYKALAGAIRLQDRVLVRALLQLADATAATLAMTDTLVFFRPD
jgi:hypothetical protein